MKLDAVSRLKTLASMHDEAVVSFKVKGEAKFLVPKLLRILSFLGSAGASRTITVEDVPADSEGRIKEGDFQIGFDGDGSDKITDITIDGVPFEFEDAFKLTGNRRVLALDSNSLVADGFKVTPGGNSYRFPNPSAAYSKAAEVIKKLEQDGFKFTTRGAMSDSMDVFKKGTTEVSISVRNSILNIDLW